MQGSAKSKRHIWANSNSKPSNSYVHSTSKRDTGLVVLHILRIRGPLQFTNHLIHRSCLRREIGLQEPAIGKPKDACQRNRICRQRVPEVLINDVKRPEINGKRQQQTGVFRQFCLSAWVRIQLPADTTPAATKTIAYPHSIPRPPLALPREFHPLSFHPLPAEWEPLLEHPTFILE